MHITPFPLTYTPTPSSSKRSEVRKDVWAQIKSLVTSNPANLDFHLHRAMTSRQVRHMSKRDAKVVRPPTPALDDAITQRQWRPNPSGVGGGASALYTRREITAWPPVPLRTSQASPDVWLSEEANQQRTWGLSQ